ncbi:adenylate/guanylate cyclase domain-containing protein [Aquimarina sp. 2201CG5-10]|uniref:adenylate/guanylate cyclase domain-containing protein n=1 Tax=Aquimarina callyspongiae TaxID=3098150 RepID=UPI002AB3F71D|nr:adenylate/guanylate cyclase domain-containing protein [Aquimarina sp. 2201CG5-10]MDY8135656.1 adenylate/guanylate cyclase domain-containing protein [Aquimarina sp. 2201CG5-10]
MKHNTSNKIHLFKEELQIDCPEDSTILDATLSADIHHTHACGGQGKCSTCRVSVMKGIDNCNPRNEAEQQIANKLSFPLEIRLACQTRIKGDISIRRMVSDKLDMDLISEQFSENSGIALGRQQELTIVFVDIVNYTSFAEKFPPYDIVHVLNRYYRIMNTIITENRGVISDVAGDGILAVFGTDKTSENSVLDAIHTIEGMNKRLKRFNKYLEENFNTNFGIRAGIHYGSVIIGPFDTGAMKKMAIIGDNVNYASRIESANKEFGTQLLLSQEAYQEVATIYPKCDVFETQLKGKTGKYKLYDISSCTGK